MSSKHYATALLCLACVISSGAFAQAQLSEENEKKLVSLLNCEGKIADLFELTSKDDAIAGITRKKDSASPFIYEYTLSRPITALGYSSDTLLLSGQGVLIAIKDEPIEVLAKKNNLIKTPAYPGSQRYYYLRALGLGAVLTASEVRTHPGVVMLGCDYTKK